MDEVCSYQLLTSVRRMVLTLTQQKDENKEFVRFFHRQLGGILQVDPPLSQELPCITDPRFYTDGHELRTTFLTPLYFLPQDSLSKFAGRTLKDCGEDLLVEISEILFNELAFFRLMQDLDNSSSSSNAPAAKHKNKRRVEPPNNMKCKSEVWLSLCTHAK